MAMQEFDPTRYGTKVAELLSTELWPASDSGVGACELGPGRPNSSAKPLLNSLGPNDIVESVSDQDMAECCIAGLWLWHNYLDRSHDFSQEIHSTSGSLWHGIMHRREPDYSNAKYWYRRVGDHPIFVDLHETAVDLASKHEVEAAAGSLIQSPNWVPYAFVDLCAAAARGQADVGNFCQEVAVCEWQLLFDYCYQQA
jgi:hypothetical protein